MIRSIRPVRFGMLLGFLGLILGIGWAIWLVVGHERIHQSLEGIAARAGRSAHVSAMHHDDEQKNENTASGVKVHIHKDGTAHKHASVLPEDEKGHDMAGGNAHNEGSAHSHSDSMAAAQPGEISRMAKGGHEHNDPVMALSHTRLVRGHLHAMGLGLATILTSFVLAFTNGSGKIKTAASVLTGIGGIVYPFAWIVMGYLTPALGPEGAEASVIYIAGPGVGFVLLGVFTAAFFLLRDIFKNKD